MALWRGGDPLTKRRLTQEERGEVKEYWVSTAPVDKSDASNTGQTLIRLLDDDWNVDKNDKQAMQSAHREGKLFSRLGGQSTSGPGNAPRDTP